MVQAKQTVSVVNNAGGIQVTSSGIAMENGRLGDLIKVRNLSSNNILHGFVVGSKKISIGTKIN
jgi:flagella basal body P-ring formation protein FlgA